MSRSQDQSGSSVYRLDLASGAVSVALSPLGSRDFSLSPDGTQLVSGELEPRRIVIVDIDDGGIWAWSLADEEPLQVAATAGPLTRGWDLTSFSAAG